MRLKGLLRAPRDRDEMRVEIPWFGVDEGLHEEFHGGEGGGLGAADWGGDVFLVFAVVDGLVREVRNGKGV